MSIARIGIVTVSDRASRGEYEDKGGPAIRAWFKRVLSTPWEAVARVIPDEQALIEAALIELSDVEGCSLIVTTGGTGVSPSDRTPEATRAVIDKMSPADHMHGQNPAGLPQFHPADGHIPEMSVPGSLEDRAFQDLLYQLLELMVQLLPGLQTFLIFYQLTMRLEMLL